jgi:hypothetical protein
MKDCHFARLWLREASEESRKLEFLSVFHSPLRKRGSARNGRATFHADRRSESITARRGPKTRQAVLELHE